MSAQLIEPAARPIAGAIRPTGEFLRLMGLSLLLGVFLLGSLIIMAGPWNILANTRLLSLLIDSGVIKYHDRDAGFVEGVADHLYYLKSQEPVEWSVIILACAVLMVFWVLKTYQFHDIARYHGLSGSFGQNARAYLDGLALSKLTPLNIGEAGTAAALQARGGSPQQIYSTLFLFQQFVVFEIIVYALFGLLGIGWSTWLLQMVSGLAILGVLVWWTRGSATAASPASWFAGIKAHAQELFQRPARLTKLSLLSLAAQGLDDIAIYLVAMAFSTQQVLLHVSIDLVLMALIAGYLARLIPLSPWGIGQFEWAFTLTLYLGGMGLPEAASLTLLYSFFYYLSFVIFYLLTRFWRGVRVSLQTALNQAYHPPQTGVETPNRETDGDVLATPPAVPIPHIPAASALWRKALIVAAGLLGLFFFDRLTLLLSDFWLLESLGFSQVFWTNFGMSAALFVSGTLVVAAAIALPAFLHPLAKSVRIFFTSIAGLVGLLAGYWLADYYLEYLLLAGQPFGKVDPIFGIDIGFYVFTLPSYWVTWQAALWAFIAAFMSSVICASLATHAEAQHTAEPRMTAWLGQVATLPTLMALTGLGFTIAVGVWLSRFNLLLQEGYATTVFTGASYIDIDGFFSTLNQIQLTALTVVGVTVALIFLLWARRQQASGRGGQHTTRQTRFAGTVIGLFIAVDLAFAGLVSLRDTIFVTPNQPVIQLPYIERHIAATRHAYGLDKVEEIEFVPRNGDDPLPNLDSILASSTMQNAPLWPTYVSYLEQLVDPQHAHRILQTAGDNMIYGPTLEIFRQQEKLRTYYDFLDVDVLRYNINGEKTILVSAVRELPILEPQPWLAWWGQRFMLFTHGHGLVTAPVGRITMEGDPVFTSGQIPIQAAWPEVAATNPQVYYGEGNASMAVSNVRSMTELDYPTNQGRAEFVLPPEANIGVKVDSLLKRLVFGWRSGEFWEMVFSTLITPETRLHYFRQPLQRLQHVAPFLYFESNPYATIVNGEITWLVNALTTSDQYPYAKHEYLGDKSLSRSPTMIETLRVNYVEDSVKATVNAATGQVQLYKISDAPVVNTWAQIYPGLFIEGDQMPTEVRQQLTYPLHLFHIQFDDLYIYYHMNDPMYFFNMEDMLDDADEVLGPVLDQGKAITFSIEPYHMLVETGGALPASTEKQQFVMTMPYTPEGARNLRAMPMVYQDGEDYGRLFTLMVPKGLFITGPEQADAIIDQDPDISEKISWWNRRGTEVIRGHTSLLLIDNEIVYIEPLFIRSQQNTVTQLKRVIVVLRGHAYMAETLEDAIRTAVQDVNQTNREAALP